jgi:hypothetical protein
MAYKGVWCGEEFLPETSQARLDKDEVKRRRLKETKAIKVQLRRIGKRQSIGNGWDGKADNDNPSLPIIKALLAEGNNDLLPALLLYRRVEAAATSGAELLGGATPNSEPLHVEQDLWMDERTGEIKRKGEKRSKSKDSLPWRAKATDVFTWTYTKRLPAPVPTKWNGDAKVIARIDGLQKLAEFRTALGPLVEPFEEAAIHGATLEKVGMMAGAKSSRSAMAVGRSVIHMALSVIRDRAGPITYDDLAA